MKCTVCGTAFESKRSDAKFCSSTCRSKASRGIAEDMVSGVTDRMLGVEPTIDDLRLAREKLSKQVPDTATDVQVRRDEAIRSVGDNFVQPTGTTFSVSDVRVKRECKRSDLCCTECVDFESGVHWCPNKGCGCFETREEQLASLKAFERACDHSSTVMSRCLHCGAVLFTSKADRKGLESLRRFGCGKHNGSFSCGCEEKTVPKKSE